MESEWIVKKIAKRRSYPFLLSIHYAHRLPNIIQCYGISNINSGDLIGIITYGMVPNCSFNELDWPCWELNRMCLKSNIPNLCSFFISKTIKLLPKPLLLISYADTSMNHTGAVYQSANWIYSGTSSETDEYIINGKKIHARSVVAKYGSRSLEKLKSISEIKSLEKIRQEKIKHRYFYPIANSKKQKKQMIKWVQDHYGIFPYPKGSKMDYEIQQTKSTGRLNLI